MSDLVEQLRQLATGIRLGAPKELVNSAADEIERLREALTLARNRLQSAAITATAAGMREQYDFSDWAREATAALKEGEA